MTKQLFTLFLLAGLILLNKTATAQQDDPTLFTIENTPVQVSEFLYIYNKTNGEEANFSKASLEEYLDLYTKFKLKVQKAKDMQLDTISSLQQELAGYRRQLADSYLLDREVIDRLVEEAYNRKKQDVNISHILIRVAPNATPEDTLAAYKRIKSIRQELNDGKTFEQLASTYSEDPNSKNKNGNVGFITAMLPNGFYELETVAYELPIGQVSDVVRSGVGYHLVKVNERRSARGEMEVSHILLRKEKDGSNAEQVRETAQRIYREIEQGADFGQMVTQYSQDQLTAGKGGYLGTFGINKYEDAFEDAAFAIAEDGGVSEPVETKAGFHIIKRISKNGVQPFDEMKGRLEQQVRQNDRFQLAVNSMIDRIKRETNFKENSGALQSFKDTVSTDFVTFKWRAPAEDEVAKLGLFTLDGNNKLMLSDFLQFAQSAARQRINLGREGKTVPVVVDELYKEFVAEQVLKYEEQQLEKKYPDFKALMREYEEGILLFEATKRLVWDKASQDTVGLKQFFEQNRDQYRWKDRAVVTTYTIESEGTGMLEEIRQFAAKNGIEETLAKYNKDGEKMISATQKTVEKGRNKQLDTLDWTSGTLGESAIDRQSKSVTFDKIERIIAPENKELRDARGYVVADYQDYLEKQWVESLRKEYNVKVNKRVFNKLVQK